MKKSLLLEIIGVISVATCASIAVWKADWHVSFAWLSQAGILFLSFGVISASRLLND